MAPPASATARACPSTTCASPRWAMSTSSIRRLGVLLAEPLPDDVRELLVVIQHELFNLGGELSIPGYELLKAEAVARLDEALAHYNAALPRLKEFILPARHAQRGDCPCRPHRRAPRRTRQSSRSAGCTRPCAPKPRQYLNRLSDLLFVLAGVNRGTPRLTEAATPTGERCGRVLPPHDAGRQLCSPRRDLCSEQHRRRQPPAVARAAAARQLPTRRGDDLAPRGSGGCVGLQTRHRPSAAVIDGGAALHRSIRAGRPALSRYVARARPRSRRRRSQRTCQHLSTANRPSRGSVGDALAVFQLARVVLAGAELLRAGRSGGFRPSRRRCCGCRRPPAPAMSRATSIWRCVLLAAVGVAAVDHQRARRAWRPRVSSQAAATLAAS